PAAAGSRSRQTSGKCRRKSGDFRYGRLPTRFASVTLSNPHGRERPRRADNAAQPRTPGGAPGPAVRPGVAAVPGVSAAARSPRGRGRFLAARVVLPGGRRLPRDAEVARLGRFRPLRTPRSGSPAVPRGGLRRPGRGVVLVLFAVLAGPAAAGIVRPGR